MAARKGRLRELSELLGDANDAAVLEHALKGADAAVLAAVAEKKNALRATALELGRELY